MAVAEPTPPEDVFLVAPDADPIPCILLYVGMRDGSHVWEAMPTVLPPGVEDIPKDGTGLGLMIGMLPGRTQIILSIPLERG